MKYRTAFIILFLFAFNFSLNCQYASFGNYEITNYQNSDYKAGTQNWDCSVLLDGKISFANNEGLLIFDGVNWELHPLPNQSIMRSLTLNDSGRLYVGGQDEIGYFEPNNRGYITFNSIRDKIPTNYLPLEDVWQMKSHNGKIYFRSINRIYSYDESNDEVDVINPNETITHLFKHDDQLFYTQLPVGVIKEQNGLPYFNDTKKLAYVKISQIYEQKNGLVLLTESNGLYSYKEGKLNNQLPATPYLKYHKVTASTRYGDKIIVGTQSNGIAILNNKLEIEQVVNKASGLLKNTVNTLAIDQEGNLWAGFSNGISKIKIGSNKRIIQPDGGELDTYYGVESVEDNYYFGSNNGLYMIKSDLYNPSQPNRGFTFVNGSQGQVWGLDNIDGELFMGHNNGAFKIYDNKLSALSTRPGAWTFLKASENAIYVGTYSGIDIYKKINGEWIFDKEIKGFNESSRILVSVKPNEVWVSHPYRGVYKIKHTNDFVGTNVSFYNGDKGLPSNLLNYVFKIDNSIVVAGQKGLYRYNDKTDRFSKDSILHQYINPDQNIRRMFQNSKGDIWFVGELEVGCLVKSKNGIYQKELHNHLMGNFVGGFEKMYFKDTSSIYICTDQNILQLRQGPDPVIKPKINIATIQVLNHPDSFIYTGYLPNNPLSDTTRILSSLGSVPYHQNDVKISYSSMHHEDGLEYKYKLDKNFTDGLWSSWSNKTSKEYTNLSPGSYTFSITSKLMGIETYDIVKASFKVLPPWYRTGFAYIIYGLFTLGFILSLILVPNKQYKKVKEKMKVEKEAADAEIKRIRTEQLEESIRFKNQELASSTLHLVQKNETIEKIRKEIERVRKNIKDNEAKKELKKVISLLSDDSKLEDDWDNFSYHFDQVHTDFIKRLSAAYPILTPKDKKLASYLRMNLTTKEIAPLLNISIRGVEISRYRLRKKMGLGKETNLNQFMMDY